MNYKIRTAFDSGFSDLDYSVSAYFKRKYLQVMNHLEKTSSEKAAQSLVMANRHKEARDLLDSAARTQEARRRLINQLK